jgi:hypothetical protein
MHAESRRALLIKPSVCPHCNPSARKTSRSAGGQPGIHRDVALACGSKSGMS